MTKKLPQIFLRCIVLLHFLRRDYGMKLLSGTDLAKQREQILAQKVKQLTSNSVRAPQLSVILVGDHVPSKIYVARKQEACARVGIQSRLIELAKDISAENLKNEIQKLNQDKNVDAILMQLPLPEHLNANEFLDAIHPDKDVDALSSQSVGRAWLGRSIVHACTPYGIMQLLARNGISVSKKIVAVIGRSNIVGKPMGQLLLAADATPIMCHSQTPNLAQVTSQADIVIVAAGKKQFFGKEFFKAGAVVIDVGIHRDSNNKICGDVNTQNLEEHISALSPVPGGVGPMTISALLENTIKLAEHNLRG